MHYIVFGRKTGLRVSELALGAGNIGTGWGVAAGWWVPHGQVPQQ
ncbi:hypothetical protein [Pseudomonas sp. BGI-2]|nr:hypothetical protein [Pseudomonas sp. BGI-2]